MNKQASKIRARQAAEKKANRTKKLKDIKAHHKILKSLENTEAVKRQVKKNKKVLKKYPL